MTECSYTGEVLRLAFGGEGIIHQEGFVVFVPFTAPGDHIKYRITKRKKNFAYGEMLEILQPSPERIQPKCPSFGICGGCQLQHISYKSQLEQKRQSIQDALVRQAKLPDIIVPEVIPASQQWSYRRRISLTLKPSQGHYIAGYTAIDGKSILPVAQCPIFVEPDEHILNQLQAVSNSFISTGTDVGKATILKRNNGAFLISFHFKNLPSNAEVVLKDACQRYPQWTGILASSPKQTLKFGQLETQFEIAGLTFDFSPKAFIQNHPEQSLNIYRSLCKHVLMHQPKKILDLYCGIGISSLMIARQSENMGLERIVGVENNKEAILLAQENAKNNGIQSVDFRHADVENILAKLLQEIQPDVVIVNPPREGLHPSVIQSLLSYAPPVILYISCMPPTLARDLKLLCNEKYRVDSVEAYDMFPQTAHVETLVTCRYNG